MISLSQSHLTHLDTCGRKYQYIFFDALSGPSTYDQHLTTQWGSQFHLLMQQQAMNLPVGALAQVDTEMTNSLSALKEAAPEVFRQEPLSQEVLSQEAFSQSEHRRTFEFNGYLLTVIYDLLVTSPSTPNSPASGQIFDWKTHQQPQKKEWLQQDWQTRLYSYVLCETSGLTPEQISMTYWFVRVASQKPSFYRFDYTLAQHDKTRKDLQRLTDSLTQMRAAAEFPKVAIEKGLCDRCPFNARCDRAMDPLQQRDRTSPDQFQPPESTDHTQILKAASQLTAETVEEIPL